VLPLGLYRMPGARDNKHPFVYTHPARDTRLSHNDRIFLLAAETPDQLFVGDALVADTSDASEA
jgi:acetyl-CoA C-acetyltransferase/potassium large conductance calcium-activated channel subfamily M alpha protein 1